MATVKTVFAYGGAANKMHRLGLRSLVEELQQVLCGTEIRVLERKHANGGGEVRELLDRAFAARGWQSGTSDDIDWMKSKIVKGTRVSVGIELQVSARSELLYRDFLHLRNQVVGGDIDIGVIVVPSDRFHSFLPDHTPSVSCTLDVLRITSAEGHPILVVEIEHDGPGSALKKRRKVQL
jgi:hypothetical protein